MKFDYTLRLCTSDCWVLLMKIAGLRGYSSGRYSPASSHGLSWFDPTSGNFGFAMQEVAADFIRILRFPLPVLVPLIAPLSFIILPSYPI
jgi:hypothetical protein